MNSNGYLHRMLKMLTSAYHSSPLGNIGKLFSIFADALEEIKATAEQAKLWRDVDKAKGVTLDRWGLNVGVAREGLEDDLYRLLIKVKIIALLSGGDIETIIQSVGAILNIEPVQIDFKEVFPAKIRMMIPMKAAEPYGSVVLIQRFIKNP